MSTPDPADPTREPSLTPSDIYRAARDGVLPQQEASRLVAWAYRERAKAGAAAEARDPAHPPRARRINRETVASYAGAVLMIAATNWLLGVKWDELGPAAVLAVCVPYALLAWRRGARLWRDGVRPLQGGLLVTVAVAQVPLITYCLQTIFHLWPGGQPPLPYVFFHAAAHPDWVWMALATACASLAALHRVHFTFLAAPLGYACLLLTRDLPLWATGYPPADIKVYLWASASAGLLTVLAGVALGRRRTSAGVADLTFWPCLFGAFALWNALAVLAALRLMPAYALLLFGAASLAAGARTRRKTFLVFGALALDQSLQLLAHLTYRDSFFFPFALTVAGFYLLFSASGGRREARN